jgi:hypothetical protein
MMGDFALQISFNKCQKAITNRQSDGYSCVHDPCFFFTNGVESFRFWKFFRKVPARLQNEAHLFPPNGTFLRSMPSRCRVFWTSEKIPPPATLQNHGSVIFASGKLGVPGFVPRLAFASPAAPSCLLRLGQTDAPRFTDGTDVITPVWRAVLPARPAEPCLLYFGAVPLSHR